MDDFSFKELKTKFNELKSLRQNVLVILEQIDTKLDRMDTLYDELLGDVDNNLFIIGLDAYYFQKQFFKMEFEHILLYFSMISNRIYFDYYKLFKTIKHYVVKNRQ